MRKYLHILALAALLTTLLPLTAQAIPAYPRPFTVTQPDGSRLTIRLVGDEHGYNIYSEQGLPLRHNARTGFFEPTKRPIALRQHPKRRVGGPRRVLINDFPAFGTQRSLVILVEFADTRFTTMPDPYAYYNGLLNEEGFTHENGAHGSARDYYHSCSYGQFDPQFDVVGPVTLPHEAAYYGSNRYYTEQGRQYQDIDTCMAQFVVDACREASALVDYSAYDTNHDGQVDNIYFFYAGCGEADSGISSAIWPHAARLSEDWGIEPLQYNGVSIDRYACSNEIRFGTSPQMPVGIGTFVHEFGHVLGLADHYDTMGTSGRIGVQQWDTMAAASYNDNQNTPPAFSAFERAEIGWLTFRDIDALEPGLMKLHSLIGSNEACRIMVPDTDGREYFIIENRQQEGWDRTLPGHGLLVWHVDMDNDAWFSNTLNTDATHQRLDLVEADGLENAQTYTSDPYPGTGHVSSFDFYDWSHRNLFSFDMAEETDTTANFLLARTAYQPDRPDLTVSDIHGSRMHLAWPPVADAQFYRLTVEAENIEHSTLNIEHSQLNILSPLRLESVSYHRQAEHSASIEQTILPGEPGQELQAELTGLMPETEYRITLTAHVGSYTSETTRHERTTALEFFEMQPQVAAPTHITPTSFTAHWQPLTGADGYSITLYRHEYTDEQSDSYDFSDKANGLPTPWTTTSTTYNRALFGAAAPSLQLGKDGDALTFSYPGGELVRLSFWHRSQTKSNILHIEQLADGQWQELEAVGTSSAGEQLTFDLPRSSDVRIRLERKSGYVVIDDVQVAFLTLGSEPVGGHADILTGNTTLHTFSGLEEGIGYGYRVVGLQGDVRSEPSAEMPVSLHEADPTALDAIGADPSATTAAYDLQGRRIAQTAASGVTGKKGIRIVGRANGVRKVIVK